MSDVLFSFYNKWVIETPLAALTLVGLVFLFFGLQTTEFKLDASAESLILENDEALRFYQKINKIYGSDDFLIITFAPNEDILSEKSLDTLRSLRDNLQQLDRVKHVTTILDVPLLNSPKVALSEISKNVRTLETLGTDKSLARKEFLESPIYKNMLLSQNERITVLQVLFKRDEKYFSLLHARNNLREKKRTDGLTPEAELTFEKVTQEFSKYHSFVVERERRDVEHIRAIMERYRGRAEMFLGGVGMIVSDMISFIEHDLVTFGLGVLGFLILALLFFFRRPYWVILPLVCCFISVLVMVGFLGFSDWRVTVISSNFTSLLLILTIALTIHLIVRYRDLLSENPGADQETLVRQTVRQMFAPCFYTALTTVVAFCSLIFSDIRPVIDFGWMMTIGISLAFTLNFIFFPAALMLVKPEKTGSNYDRTQKFTLAIAAFTQKYGKAIVAFSLVLAVLSIAGIIRLEVENRFIDYFKRTTEIYQGMEIIDRQLGGTTPLDIILDADQAFYDYLEDLKNQAEEDSLENSFERDGKDVENNPDPLADPFEDEGSKASKVEEENYWFHPEPLKKVEKIHDYLNSLPEVGKVQSIAIATKILTRLNDGKLPDDYDLAILRKAIPKEIKKAIISPFLSEDANQVRLTIRVIESEAKLKRKALLNKIQEFLVNGMGLEPETVHLTGMVVLYNNMLQSLYASQIKTIGVVFVSILVMFIISFRDFFLACIALVPSVLAAGLVLGIMGWLVIPLDMMTITIAAITIGIAVDNSIHYVYRFKTEFHIDRNYKATLQRCHGSIGKAIYYTSVVVTLGFSILALSDFIPTIYFGLLTGLAMVVALINNLTLLPILIVFLKPLGTEK